MTTKTTTQPVKKTDVLIVGAGLVGSAMAILLASSEKGANLDITIVDPIVFKPLFSNNKFDARVVALTEPSRKLLDALGVWSLIHHRCGPFSHMEVHEAEGTGHIAFAAEEVDQPWLGHIVENSVIVEQLLQQVSTRPNINFLCPAKVVAVQTLPAQAGYRVELDNGNTLETNLLIAADGANSAIRSMLDFSVREWPYGQDAIVSTIYTEEPHNNTAQQWFSPTGPLAFLPLCGPPDQTGHACSIVWSQQTDEAERLMALTDQEFCKELSLITRAVSSKVMACEQRFKFPLQQRHATHYTKPGAVLIGDAAHSIHPLAGQGVNLGFQDVIALNEAINWGLNAGIKPGNEKILHRFQRQRKPENLRMMLVMEGFKRLFGSKQPIFRLLRSEGLSQLNKLSTVKNALIREAMGLG